MDFTGINPLTVMQASVRARVEHPERYRVTAPKRQKSPVQQVVHHHVNDGDGDWDVVACSGSTCVCTLVKVDNCRKPCRLEYAYEKQERIKRELMAEGMSEREATLAVAPW